jgi:hypothetical protein
MDFVIEKNLHWSAPEEMRFQQRLKKGRKLWNRIQPVCEIARMEAIRERQRARSSEARLTPEEVVEITAYLSDVKDKKIRREFYASRPFEETLQGIVVPLVEVVLNRDPEVKTAANIGGFYAYPDHVLAQRHPGVQFICVDFLPDLAEYNDEFQRANLAFLSGYALEMIEQGMLRADMVYFSATAAEIKNTELHRYFELMSAWAKYIVMSEPIYPLPGGHVLDPRSLPVDRERILYAQPDYLPHKEGPLARLHNYPKILETSGFEVLHYHAYKPAITNLRWVEIIARNRKWPGGTTPAPAAVGPAIS